MTTTAPAASRIVQVTVIGRASVNDRRVPVDSESRSCGKKSVFDVATAPSRAATPMERVTPTPLLPAPSRGVRRTSYSPSGDDLPVIALPFHDRATGASPAVTLK